YSLITSSGFYTGFSSGITVAPANAIYFTVTTPATATTGSPINVKVTALDQFSNIATGYSGQVHFSSSDASAALPPSAMLTSGAGSFTVTLNTAGSQTIAATDPVSSSPITIAGTSADIAAHGLQITSFTPTPTGFTATFNKA